MKRLLFLSATLGLALSAAPVKNSLGFRTYPQTVTMEFATEDEAHKAELTPNQLPKNYKAAYSTRWDDATPAHLKTLKCMLENHYKGNFFLGHPDWPERMNPGYLQKLQEGGNAIGLHTQTHPFLTGFNPNAQFKEYMQNRIILETFSKQCINSQALPFCDWFDSNPMVPRSIGSVFKAVGVLESPDVFFYRPNSMKKLGLTENEFQIMFLISPGDNIPDMQKFERIYAAHKKAVLAPDAKIKGISMSMHSGHTKEGLVNLAKCFQRLHENKDWWNCTHTEYGAYRYEALNCMVSKQVQGKKAIFTISRFDPAELGAALPLWMTVSIMPKAVSGVKIAGPLLEIPQTKTLPTEFSAVDANGNLPVLAKKSATKFEGIKAILLPDGENGWKAVVSNNSKNILTDCQFTFRFSPLWEKPVLRADLKSIDPGKNVTVSVSQPGKKKDLYFQYGVPYTALQMDFVNNGKRCRLYTEWTGKEPTGLPPTLQQAVFIGIEQIKGQPDLAKLSTVGTPVNIPELRISKKTDSKNMMPNAIQAVNWQNKTAFIAILDFESDGGPLTLRCDKIGHGTWWINGKQYTSAARKNSFSFEAVKGKNRLVFRRANPMLNILVYFDKEIKPVPVK